SLNAHRSSSEPPPRPTMRTSRPPSRFRSAIPSATSRPAPAPCTRTGRTMMPHAGQRWRSTVRMSWITAPPSAVTTPTARGKRGRGRLRAAANRPSAPRRAFSCSKAGWSAPRPRGSAVRTASWVTVRMRGAGSARSIARAYISPFAARDEGLEDLPALEQLERVVELRVGAELALLDVGRHALGRGLPGGARLAVLAFLLLALRAAQVARQVRLAQQGAVALVALGEERGLVHDDVGHDAGRLDRAAARREVARGRETQRRGVVEG